MATTQSDSLDDVVVIDGDRSFIAGQQSAKQESSIATTGYVSAQNMDFDPFGRLNTRRGAKSAVGNVETRTWSAATTTWTADTKYWSTTLAAGTPVDAAAFFSTGALQWVVIAQGGAIKQGYETSSFSNITGASYSGNFVYFGQLGPRLYYCDGVNALSYIDSSVANQSISAGRVTSIRILEQGTGYTSVPAITFSSGAAAATSILGYGGRVISASIVTPSSGYSSTTPPSITFAAAPSGGITATGRVNISQTPSKPKFLTSHTNRLFCASADTSVPSDTVYASDFLDGESWDLIASSVRVGGDGDPITGIYTWQGNNLIIFKQRSIYLIDADPLVAPANWSIRVLTNRVGCVSHRSIQSVGADVYFLAQDGVRSIAQIESGAAADIGQPISFPIQDKIDSISRSQQQYVCSAYYKNRYFISIPTGETSPPSISGVMVWNELSKAWMSLWTGWQPRDFFISGFDGKTRLNFADAQGKMWTWDDFSNVSAETIDLFADDAATYESFVVSRAYDCAEPLADKTGHMVQFISDNRLTGSAMTAYAYYDKDMSGSWTAMDTAINIDAGDRLRQRAFNLLSKGKWNAIQFKWGAASGKASLTGITVTAFVDNIKPQIA